jgi:multimeric flavodoxin WrbA
MSGIMKVFFDRFSDLVRIEKETGRKLRGKNMGVISNSHDSEIESTFYIPFQKSAAYLGMNYIGNNHYNADQITEKNKLELVFI